VRLYDRLFSVEDPDRDGAGESFLDRLNPDSLETLYPCFGEPALNELQPGQACQFERMGYFCADADSTAERPVFNRTVGLRDAWARIQQKNAE
jgi:glutaminyl-tRNA synthetase